MAKAKKKKVKKFSDLTRGNQIAALARQNVELEQKAVELANQFLAAYTRGAP